MDIDTDLMEKFVHSNQDHAQQPIVHVDKLKTLHGQPPQEWDGVAVGNPGNPVGNPTVSPSTQWVEGVHTVSAARTNHVPCK